MRPVIRSRTLAAGVVGAIAASQTPGGAGNLVINGTLASGGVATLPVQQQIGITSAGVDNTFTLTVTGTDANGAIVTETLTGPNATTVKTVNSYLTITRIAVSGAAAAALTVDTVQAGQDQPVILDRYQNPLMASVSVEVSGTVNYTVQYTNDDLFNTAPNAVVWVNSANTTLVAATTNNQGVVGLDTQVTAATVGSLIASFATAVRLVTNSGGGTATMIVNQAGLRA